MSDGKVGPYIDVSKTMDGWVWHLYDETGIPVCDSSYVFDTSDDARKDARRLQNIFVKNDLRIHVSSTGL